MKIATIKATIDILVSNKDNLKSKRIVKKIGLLHMNKKTSNPILFPLTQEKNNVLINLTICPSSKKNAFIKIDSKSITISLKADPSNGQANQSLIEFFSSFLGKLPSQFIIKKGHTSPKKTLLVKNSTLLEITNFLQTCHIGL
jgi:uncharacterized protein (TIGR00251 family)